MTVHDCATEPGSVGYGFSHGGHAFRIGVLLFVAPLVHGCRAADRHSKAEEVAALRGVSAMEPDGPFLRLKRDADAAGLTLLVAGQEVEQARLRVGDRFALADERKVPETYQLLTISDERITLKKQTIIDRRASHEGVRTVESVIALTPYNLEETD